MPLAPAKVGNRRPILLLGVLILAVGGCASSPAPPGSATLVATTTDPSIDEGPAAVGQPVEIGDWVLRISRVAPNADPEIVPLAPFNLPSPDGRQRFMIRLEATYAGESSGRFEQLSLALVAADGDEYDGFNAPCGVIPDPLGVVGEVFRGGTAVGNACWQIPTEDTTTPLVRVSAGDGSNVFMSADPTAGVGSGSTVPGGLIGFEFAPQPAGEVIRAGSWDLKVTGHEESSGPTDGVTAVTVSLEATFTGDETGWFWAEVAVKPVGHRRVAYEAAAYRCGSLANPIDAAGDIATGETVAGALCWLVPSDEADSLVLVVDEAHGSASRRWFLAVR